MCACREREGFSSITSKLSRMVGDVKRKRKEFAAQHVFLLDLLAAPPSSPAFTPLFPFSHSPSKRSKLPHFASHTSSPSPSASPLQQPTTYSTPCTTNSSPLRTHDAPRSASISPQCILKIDPYPEKKDLHAHTSPPLHSNPSPLSASVPPYHCRGKHSVHHTLWAVILLALLCTFLCISKEIAFVVAMALHLILQLALGLGLLARGPNVNYAAQASFHPHHEGFENSVEKDSLVGSNGHTRSLNRSLTVPHTTFATSRQWNRRSKSWTTLHSSVEGEMQPSKAGDSVDSTSSEQATISSPRRGNLSAKLKLQMVLLFTLGGLFHGRFLAMCMALCCILIYSIMERIYFKRRL